MSDMMRREDIKRFICDNCMGCEYPPYEHEHEIEPCNFIKAFEKIPAVDTVEVIRCAECIYAYEQSEHTDSAVRLLNVSPRCPMYDHYNHLVVASGYCCMGVRKEDCNK